MAQYLHPSVSTKIIDQSAVFQTANGTTALFQVIQSPLGPDSQLVRVTDPTEFIFKFGTPNLAKYGQGAYNVLNWLKGGGVAYVLRVLPSTSTYAHTGIVATATRSDSGANVQITSLSNKGKITSVNSAKTYLSDNRQIADKAVTIPLGMVLPNGRGDGYNGLGIKFSLRNDLDSTYNFRTYNALVTVKDSLGNDVNVEGPFLVSFDPEAISRSRASLFWEDVINSYSKYLRVVAARTAFDELGAFLFNDDAHKNVSPEIIDILSGKPRTADEAALYQNITWTTAETAAAAAAAATDPKSPAATVNPDLYAVNKVSYLQGGAIGDWTGSDSEDALTVRAYNGLVDPSVLDKRSNEFDVLLDANFAPAVKQAISDLASNLRGDCFAILDLGFQGNEQQTLDYRNNTVTVANSNTAIFGQDMEVYDEYNGLNIRVTTPYLLANKIPANDTANGIQYTFVGPRRGVVSGFENLNFVPNPTWCESLYKAKVNYIERDPKKYNLGTQLTTQAVSSALSDINNVRALLKIVRDVEAMMSDYRMEFNDSITHDSANADLSGYLAKWTANRTCSSISGAISASTYERQQKMASVNISLTFTGIMERIDINISIGA